jgi:hypothetical protein
VSQRTLTTSAAFVLSSGFRRCSPKMRFPALSSGTRSGMCSAVPIVPAIEAAWTRQAAKLANVADLDRPPRNSAG